MKKKNNYKDLHLEVLKDIRANEFYLNDLEVKALIDEFSNTYINAVDNPLASQVIQRMILWNNERNKK